MKYLFSGLFTLGIGWTLLFLGIPFLFNPSGMTTMVLASTLGMFWMIQHGWFRRGNPRAAALVLCAAALIYAATYPPALSWTYLSEFAVYVLVYGGLASFGTMFAWFCWRDVLSRGKKNVRMRAG